MPASLPAPTADAIPDGYVRVRVLKNGAGQISTGARVLDPVGAADEDATFAQGDLFVTTPGNAADLESRGLAFIDSDS